jgi:hypothetical protein
LLTPGKNIMRKLFIFFTVIGLSPLLQGQASPLSLHLNAGVANLPMKNWSDFSESISSSDYEKDNLATNIELELEYDFKPNYSILLTLSKIEYQSNLYTAFIWVIETDDTIDYSFGKTHYDFQSIPISIGLKLYPDFNIPSYISFNLGYYFSKVHSQSETIFDRRGYLSFPNQPSERTGRGYGVEVGFGIEPRISDHITLATELSYRYADGMGLTDKPGSVKVEFTGLYLTVKLGWRF